MYPCKLCPAISIHALLAESDLPKPSVVFALCDFYPRSPCGERLQYCIDMAEGTGISIHALLAESDALPPWASTAFLRISIHALLAESDIFCAERFCRFKFLSTLSLRRATGMQSSDAGLLTNFYPRSPCGERRIKKPKRKKTVKFLSTLSLRRATKTIVYKAMDRLEFLSTLSLRRATPSVSAFLSFSVDFYPRSPCGERPFHPTHMLYACTISIHALLAESDSLHTTYGLTNVLFLSTLSLRRATLGKTSLVTHLRFLSTLSLRRATFYCYREYFE